MMQQLLIAGVKAYRLLLSPWLGSSCRFTPTCSVFALQALEQHGAAVGAYLTLKRLSRCHPWCSGGHDAVPDKHPAHNFWPFIGRISSSSTKSKFP